MDIVNEESAIITGHHRGGIWLGRLRQHNAGAPTEVTFDWDWTLAREERYGDVLGFFHTHPGGFPTPSARDIRTMRAWVTCLGKPLLCVIASGDRLSAYLFKDDEDNGQEVEAVERFPRNVIVAVGVF